MIVHKFNVHSGNYALVAVLLFRKQEESTRGQIRQVESGTSQPCSGGQKLLVFLFVSE